jgi:hypothetical protein
MVVVQMISTLDLIRISCKACLSAGRLSMNDTDDTEETIVQLI